MLIVPKDTILEGLKSFGLAFLLSALLSVPVMALLRALKAKQSIHTHAPEGHKAKEGTPTMGGLIVLAGMLPITFISGLAPSDSPSWLVRLKEGIQFGNFSVAWLIGAFAIIGFLDDYVFPRSSPGSRGMSWGPKLLLQIGASALAPMAIGLPFHPVAWGIVMVVVIAFANAYNFADGLDSLAGSLGVVLCLALAAMVALVQPVANLGPIMACAGGLVAFLFVNTPPARVFMGDVGSLAVGSLLGLMTCAPIRDLLVRLADPVQSAAEDIKVIVAPEAMILPLLVLGFVMIAELLPVPLQVAYYKATKGKRLFPMTPIHHAFEKKGWPESRVVWTFLWVQVLLAIGALAWTISMLPVVSIS